MIKKTGKKNFHSRMTYKGQVTVPLAVRDALALSPGDYVSYVSLNNGDFVLRKENSINKLAGSLSHYAKDRPYSIQEIRSQLEKTFVKKYAKKLRLNK